MSAVHVFWKNSCDRTAENEFSRNSVMMDLPEFGECDLLANPVTAEWILVFLSCALTELGSAKNSLIGVIDCLPSLCLKSV